jgi:hypothetical protein
MVVMRNAPTKASVWWNLIKDVIDNILGPEIAEVNLKN